MKKHTTTHWGQFSPEAYISNGVIGFRAGKNPFKNMLGLLAGFTSVRKREHVEAMSVIPTPQYTFAVNRVVVEPEIIKQEYDFANGEFTTYAKVACVDIVHTMYCSRTCPTLLISHFEVSGLPTTLQIEMSFDVRDSHKYTVGEASYWNGTDKFDGKCLLKSADNSTSAGIAYRIYGNVDTKQRGNLSSGIRMKVSPEVKEFQQITSYVPSVMHSEPHNQAQRMIGLASWEGVERIREDNRKAWAKLWESRILVEGAKPEWQDVLDASFFYLMTSASEFSPISVPPYGLGHPYAYEGHAFWDTESFIFMTPLFCAPKIARNMLDYRVERIPAAKNNAKLNGYQGIQFPWQSGTTGDEVTVPWCTQAGEQHVNLDIALAFDGYARLTGDYEYIQECVWPIMRGVSDWIESRVEKTDRGYEIFHITGIDEETDDVNNDSYTNLMCAKVLRSAAEYSEMLGHGKRPKWLEIADHMFIPRYEDGVIAQYENASKDNPRAVALMSHFPYGYSDETDYETMKFYVYNGMEQYCHYPMLSGFMGVYPAWIGDRETSLRFYEKANLTFFCAPFFSSMEWGHQIEDQLNPPHPLVTNFITARGSLLSGMIMGLTKVCPWKGSINAPVEEWLGENIVLPDGWTKITIGKVYIRGKAYKITAEQGAQHAVLEEYN